MKGQGTSHPRKRYDAEFKRGSVRLADTSGKTDRQIERDQGAIRRRRDELEADPNRLGPRLMLSRRSEPTVSRRQIFSFSFLPSFFAASVTLSPSGSRASRCLEPLSRH